MYKAFVAGACCALIFLGCQNPFRYSPPPPSSSKAVLWYEDEYIIDAKGEWCPWTEGVRSCPEVYAAGRYNLKLKQ